jgi:uncharacterized protein (DUF302 family)
MFYRSTTLAGLVAVAAVALTAGHWANMATAKTTDDGIVRVKSTYDVDETVKRLKADIEGKGIKFFMLVDQAQLGADAGLKLNPSKLLVFGNPPLGITFLTANPNAGLDWPVRLLVNRDDVGQVWVAYTDFAWIARRHNITNRATQFKMASEVISSITASVAARKP